MKQNRIPKEVTDLIDISVYVGSDEELVQGGGGNTSVKSANGKYMYIKASGTALKDMTPEAGYLCLDLAKVRGILDDEAIAKLPYEAREEQFVSSLQAARVNPPAPGIRPSVESVLHSFLGKYVIHLHPVVINALTCSKDGKKLFKMYFDEKKDKTLWIDYVRPGFILAQKIKHEIEKFKKNYTAPPEVLLLANHGIFVAGNNKKNVKKLTEKYTHKINALLKRREKRFDWDKPLLVKKFALPSKEAENKIARGFLPRLRKFYTEKSAANVFLAYNDSPIVMEFVNAPKAGNPALTGAMTPEEIIYCGRFPLWVSLEDFDAFVNNRSTKVLTDIEAFKKRWGYLPKVLLIENLGGIALGSTTRNVELAWSGFTCALKSKKGASVLGGSRILPPREAELIETWEFEEHRKTVLSQAASETKPLLNKVALVTGAGSGLGKAIATGFARAGAVVALADIDTTSAKITEEKITGEGGKAFAVTVDVTDEASIETMVTDVVKRYGGVDILVNAAGIAPPFALVEFPYDLWKKTLDINLSGYFLCAREAARVMIAQDMGGNIINLSSKTGLDASKSNSAYNATKSGEIHLARGWAMELGEFDIRVNSVAPGNVFEGSKIWNPEYIKECAKKKGIKPKEVIPYYVNLTSLKKEIKGEDVANTCIFLCTDKARVITGQVIVPDGGQVFVR